MSLANFHKVFIVAAFACLALTFRWAIGHNAAALVTPWAAYGAGVGMAALLPYFIWSFKRYP
jgi:hypothetical protein